MSAEAADADDRSTTRVGFIGTGLIGTPMVARLRECERDVAIWNRTPVKMAPLVTLGAHGCTSPQAVVLRSDVVCLCLTDTAAVHDVMFGTHGIATALRAGQVVVDFSSIAPDATISMAATLRAATGAGWVDAPVSGGLPAARAGRLIIFVGGTSDDIARAKPVFDALSMRVTHMGGQGAGQLAKSCNQMIVACNNLVIAEMLAFAARAGIDANRLPAALAGGFADSLPLQIFGPRMAAHVTTPKIGAIATFRKDIAQVARLAETYGAFAPMTARAVELYAAAVARDDIGAGADIARIIRMYEHVDVHTGAPPRDR